MAILIQLGFHEIVNPSDFIHADEVIQMKADGCSGAEIMIYFAEEVTKCDALAFRALPDGAIPAGVAEEIKIALTRGMPVIELPSSVQRRTLSVDLTREYLKESG
jgi:hypothetical protein